MFSIDNEYHELVCKGALEEMLAICSHVRHEDEVIPLSEALLARIRRITDDLNQQGLRVVAVANKILPAQTHEYGVADESDLILEGYVAFLDPPKESTAPALAALKQNGVTVKILTGDNELVAAKVCRDVGLEADSLLRGSEIEQMDDEQLAQAAARTTVFAKLTPLHKERIVKLLRRQGTWWALWATASTTRRRCARPISASPSIRRWTSLRSGGHHPAGKKSLMVLEQGVIEGRRTFANMLKYIKMTASSNFGNVFSVLIASAFLPFLPMLPLHLLIQNLMYDISQIAIRSITSTTIRSPSRSAGTPPIWGGLWCSLGRSARSSTLTFSLMWWVFKANTPEMQTLFQSGWFVEGLLSQTLIVHMIRTRKIPFIKAPPWPLCNQKLAIATPIALSSPPAAASSTCARARLLPWRGGTLPGCLVLTPYVKAGSCPAGMDNPPPAGRGNCDPVRFFTATVGHLFWAESLSTALAVFPAPFKPPRCWLYARPPVT